MTVIRILHSLERNFTSHPNHTVPILSTDSFYTPPSAARLGAAPSRGQHGVPHIRETVTHSALTSATCAGRDSLSFSVTCRSHSAVDWELSRPPRWGAHPAGQARRRSATAPAPAPKTLLPHSLTAPAVSGGGGACVHRSRPLTRNNFVGCYHLQT